jgi:hypothetical protein
MKDKNAYKKVKPALAAGTLTGVNVIPMTNIAGAMTTYDFFFRTATTGTIKTIEINFPPLSVDPRNATVMIEKIGIGSGKLAGFFDMASVSKLTYTVTNPVSVAAGTNIRLEVARIIAVAPGDWFARIATKNTSGNIIDGPTQSPPFLIKGFT